MKVYKGAEDREGCIEKLKKYISGYLGTRGSFINPEETDKLANSMIADVESGKQDLIELKKGGFDRLHGENIDGMRVVRGLVDGRYFEWMLEGDR